MAMKKKYNRKLYDWKDYPSITWSYTGDPLTNKKYLKDRSELFAEAGNGWWWYLGTKYLKFHMDAIKKEREEKDDISTRKDMERSL